MENGKNYLTQIYESPKQTKHKMRLSIACVCVCIYIYIYIKGLLRKPENVNRFNHKNSNNALSLRDISLEKILENSVVHRNWNLKKTRTKN